ncbi:G-type lectin S-receptor-like serine/threonine-protein kinase At4g27290 [Malania oleifera]|uniref:G-type lectin S-receptor-like serine/threonine-protein kinase At4g27290 n=1 Tax=Malania oleifera TaxID=397392 RepID=UPI0025ADB21B|nr:G-type lectin S-receptor-like serine/threonine-protein kinase At4g27290 [Malania oleifera]
MVVLYFLLLWIELHDVFPRASNVADTIISSQSLSDGQTLVSQGGSFELGFFSPGNSRKRYLGIWYKNIPIRTFVWVANRENPINDFSGVLMINSTGSLVLLIHTNGSGTVIWSSSLSKEADHHQINPIVAQLLDSGNLVLKDEKGSEPESYLWQSFDYPTDTLLPGMKVGWDLRSGLNRRLTSWKSADDPSPGDLSYGIELHNFPEPSMWKGHTKIYRAGPWNGIRYSGAFDLRPNPLYQFDFNLSQEAAFYTYQLKNKSVITRTTLSPTTNSYDRSTWVEVDRTWEVYVSVPRDHCDSYGLCGAHGICVISESPVCECLKGFMPKSPESWNSMDWSNGCVRDKPLNCPEDGFAKFEGVKVPDTTYTWVNTSKNLKGCQAKCLANCSCMAYTNTDIRSGGSGCAMWFGDLIDIRQLPASGQDLYIRMPNSELSMWANNWSKMKSAVVTVAAIATVSGMLIISLILSSFTTFKKKTKANNVGVCRNKDHNIEVQKEDQELPLFKLTTIANATNNFSPNNKLGEGGFGAVYKGALLDGQEIAVKRLSMNSRQGLTEFKNEVILIAKLQHRNLVRLLGCCIQGEEMMLIYEYMPNKSLDYFIFDQTRSKLLDWSRCFHIICGIARGLLYLHQDSRLRIIHRDLKASNVLLDDEMTPKISDFGLAKNFESDQNEARTRRIVGTYGYMAPEYAIDGLYSIKSDVFSFGVLLLEIVSGEKNRGFDHPSHSLNLIGHAWKLWNEGKPFELMNALYMDSCSVSVVLRCIHIGLLCVQQHPEDRPNMSYVVLMLDNESPMPQPKQPGFFIGRNPLEEPNSSMRKPCSNNELTLTSLEAR